MPTKQKKKARRRDPVVFMLTHLPKVLGHYLRMGDSPLIAEFSEVSDATVRSWLRKYRRHARRIVGSLYETVGYFRDFDEDENDSDVDIFDLTLDEIIALADKTTTQHRNNANKN